MPFSFTLVSPGVLLALIILVLAGNLIRRMRSH